MEMIYPPMRRYSKHRTLFLAGSIEMGKARKWQEELYGLMWNRFTFVYNPRRLDWDSAWAQEIDDNQFNAQVNWELDMIDEATHVVFYFDPLTKSPITLMELGLVAGTKSDNQVTVCCPKGYWRKGNVDIICERAGFVQVDDISSLAEHLNRNVK